LFRNDASAQESGGGRRGGPGGGGSAPREIDAWLHIAEDGSVTAYTGKVEVGQNARTSLAQAVADELRLPADSVVMVMGDTVRVPSHMGPLGSRPPRSRAPRLRRASAAARGLLVKLAAEQWNVDWESVEVSGGKVTHPPTGRSLGFGELTRGRKLVEAIGGDE